MWTRKRWRKELDGLFGVLVMLIIVALVFGAIYLVLAPVRRADGFRKARVVCPHSQEVGE